MGYAGWSLSAAKVYSGLLLPGLWTFPAPLVGLYCSHVRPCHL